MHACPAPRECRANDWIQAELVAATVDTQLQVVGQSKLADRERNHRQIIIEFAFELREIADIINSLVESPGKLGRDGLQSNLLISESSKDE